MITTVWILGQVFDVEYSHPKDWSTNGMGRCHAKETRITIRDDMSPHAQDSCLVHEIVHAIADINGLPFNNDEQLISTLAASLYAFVRDNPDVMKEICNRSNTGRHVK